MRVFLSHVTLVACLAVPFAGCSDDPTDPGADAEVAVRDDVFDPQNVTIQAGEEVLWEWDGNNQHNVTWVAGGVANSATQASGTYTRTFGQAGTYDYYCTIHGTPTAGMRGSVAVQ